MPTIKDHFSLEQAANVVALVKEKEVKIQDYWNEFVVSHGIPPVVLFLLELKRDGQFHSILNAEGHATWELTNWQGFITSVPESAEEAKFAAHVAQRYAHNLLFRLTYPVQLDRAGNPKPEAEHFDLVTQYNLITEKFDQCDWEFNTCSGDRCSQTGKYIALDTPNWKPVAKYLADNRMQPLTPAAPAKLVEVKVEFHTGNLLINDWFRVGKFTEQVKTKHSLDSRVACENYVQAMYSEHGFLTIPAHDGCVGLLHDGNSLIGCSLPADNDADLPVPSYSLVGEVSADLWAVSIIEYEQLVELVSQKISRAQVFVDDYLSKQRGQFGLSRMKVEPGTYYLYHAGNHEDLPGLLKQAGITEYEPFEELCFVLSKKKLLK